MIAVALLAPKMGAQKAIPIALAIFFILALIYLKLVQRFGWFNA
jgi:hypothetical protein